MYKKRFKAWAVRKYKTDATAAALANSVQMSNHGCDHLVGAQFHRASNGGDITRQSKAARGKRKAGLSKKERPDAESSFGQYEGTNPSTTDRQAVSSSRYQSIAPLRVQPETPQSSRDESPFSSSDSPTIFTPSSSDGTMKTSPQVTASDNTQADLIVGDMQKTPVVASKGDSTSNLADPALPSFSNEISYQVDQLHALDIGSEVARLSDSVAASPDTEFNTDFHRLLATSSPKAGCYRFARNTRSSRCSAESLSTLEDVPEPWAYVSRCFLSCIHQGQGRIREAKFVAADAAQMYGILVKHQHEQALACLDIVLRVLFYHGQIAFVAWLLEDALTAAMSYLEENDNFVLIIKFLIAQANSKAKDCDVTLSRLETIYADFKEHRGSEHPYTLIAGYHVAWRLSLEDEKGQVAALRLLQTLQGSFDHVFGVTHMEAIGNLTTTSRVLQSLERDDEAEEVMKEAMRRIDEVFPPCHPYSLETKTRYAQLLRGIDEYELAERMLIEVAVGRVEVLGPDNELSRRSIVDVEQTLCVAGREQDHAKFQDALTLALRRRSMRSPEIDYCVASIKCDSLSTVVFRLR